MEALLSQGLVRTFFLPRKKASIIIYLLQQTSTGRQVDKAADDKKDNKDTKTREREMQAESRPKDADKRRRLLCV